MNDLQNKNILEFLPKESSTKQRLINVFKKHLRFHYKSSLDYLANHDLTPHLKNLLVENQGQFIINGKNYYIGCFLKKQLIGALHFEPSEETLMDIEKIEKCKTLILEITLPALIKDEELKRIRRANNHLNQLLNEDHSSDVVSLFNQHKEVSQSKEKPQKTAAIKVFSNCSESIQRKAVDLHQHSGNFCLLPFSDLDEETRTSFNKMKDLSEVTVFVENYGQLSDREKENIDQSIQSDSSCFFIIGSQPNQLLSTPLSSIDGISL